MPVDTLYIDSFTLHNYPSLPGEATVINIILQIRRNPENSSNFFKMMKLKTPICSSWDAPRQSNTPSHSLTHFFFLIPISSEERK